MYGVGLSKESVVFYVSCGLFVNKLPIRRLSK